MYNLSTLTYLQISVIICPRTPNPQAIEAVVPQLPRVRDCSPPSLHTDYPSTITPHRLSWRICWSMLLSPQGGVKMELIIMLCKVPEALENKLIDRSFEPSK